MADKGVVKGLLCHGLWILTPNPRLLRGRKMICHSVVMADILNCGAEIVLTPDRVVTDEDLVTGFSKHEVLPFIAAIARRVASNREGNVCSDVQQQARVAMKSPSQSDAATNLPDELCHYWKANFAPYLQDMSRLTERPVAVIVRALLDLLSYEVSAARDLVSNYVNRMTGIRISTLGRRNVLLVASEIGVWASEMTIPASMLLAAGYIVTVATETGAAPHMSSSSCDVDFVDGSLGVPVVSKEEAELALRFKDPNTREGNLLLAQNIMNLGRLGRPPVVADYLKNPEFTLEQYREDVKKSAKSRGASMLWSSRVVQAQSQDLQ
jgi:putative intracellular protease/amidase